MDDFINVPLDLRDGGGVACRGCLVRALGELAELGFVGGARGLIGACFDELDFLGREGVEGVDMNNLGFVDPSGGPFIAVNESYIEGRKVTNIASNQEGIFFTVKADNE